MKKLFTPGPLNTSATVKEAMLTDVGSRDRLFIEAVRFVREELINVAGVHPDEYTSVIIQGSGTFAIESAITSAVPQTGKLLLLINGVYGDRMRKIATVHGIDHVCLRWAENEAIDATLVEDLLMNEPDVTHIAWVHSETTSGAFNPVSDVSELCKKYGKSGILDAMSSFGAATIHLQGSGIDFLVSSSNKCIQGTPGFAFVVARTGALKATEGQARTLTLDLYDQWVGLEKNGQFRFTPPTLALMSFRQALLELQDEGGVNARELRYMANNRVIREGLKELGFIQYLPDEIQGHIITTFLYPADNFDFGSFYDKLNERDCVIYPGKLTQADTFRIGNIGHLFENDMYYLVESIKGVLNEMNINK